MKKSFSLLLCLCLICLLLSGCGDLFGASSQPVSSVLPSEPESSAEPTSSLPEESSSAPESEFPAEPTLQTAGALIANPGDLIERVDEFVNLCCMTGNRFEWDTLSDSTIAAAGMLLCANDEHLIGGDDGLIRLDAVYFDQAIMDYFGRPIRDVSLLTDNFPSYLDGQYAWYPSGIIMPYQFAGERVYDLGGGYLRVEGVAFHEPTGSGDESDRTDLVDTVYIVLQNDNSPYGFNMIAEQFG